MARHIPEEAMEYRGVRRSSGIPRVVRLAYRLPTGIIRTVGTNPVERGNHGRETHTHVDRGR